MQTELLRSSRPQRRTLVLGVGETLALQGARGVAIEALGGPLWLTVSGEPGDIILAPGQSYRLTGNGRAVMEAAAAVEVRVGLSFPAQRSVAERLIPPGWRQIVRFCVAGALRRSNGLLRSNHAN